MASELPTHRLTDDATALMADDPRAAIPAWTAVIEADPASEQPRLQQAACWRAVGDIERAEDGYHQILSMVPDSAGALIGLAEIAAARGDIAEARRRWERFRDAFPASLWGHYWVAWTVAEAGDVTGSAALLETALSEGHEPAPLHERLVELYIKLDRIPAAIDHFKILCDRFPLKAERLDQLAHWIIHQIERQPGFPVSVFDMDDHLLRRVLMRGPSSTPAAAVTLPS